MFDGCQRVLYAASMERGEGCPPHKDAAERLIDELELESVFSLNEWRHDLVTQLDNWLFLSEELDVLERHSAKLNDDERYAHFAQLTARAREYVQYESRHLEPRLALGTPVQVSGKLLWHTYAANGKRYTELLPGSCQIKGQYFDCDIAPYYAPDALHGVGDDIEAYWREVGVHMIIKKPLICSRTTGRVVGQGIDYMYVPLHYDTADFMASIVHD